MDIEVCMEAKRVADKQLNNAIGEIESLKARNDDLQRELDTMYRKVTNTEKDRDQMKVIMTNNIMQSNETIQNLHSEIGALKAKIVELKAELKFRD